MLLRLLALALLLSDYMTRQVLNAIPRYNERAFTLAKSKSHGKIDAAVALCLAYDQALRSVAKIRPALWVG